jgi:hypothetical protein
MQQLLMPRQFTHQPMLHWDPPGAADVVGSSPDSPLERDGFEPSVPG